LLARDEEELHRAESDLRQRGARVFSAQCDVTNETDVHRAIEAVADHFGTIDVLVNNAGIIQVGPLEHMSVRDFEQTMAVHFFGPLHVILAALPYLQRQGGGRIVNIASAGGKIAFPHLLPYSASKFALVGLSDGLRAELQRQNIFVTTVCPGLMRTGSPRNAQFKGRHHREYAWFAISDSLPLLSMSAESAARKIIDGAREGSARVILGIHTKAAVLMNELFPGITADSLALINRLLPSAEPAHHKEVRSGKESESAWVPSVLTHLTQRAALRNNEHN
jgi:short-subunit dehydrogenase